MKNGTLKTQLQCRSYARDGAVTLRARRVECVFAFDECGAACILTTRFADECVAIESDEVNHGASPLPMCV